MFIAYHSQYSKAIAHPVDIISLCLIKKLLEKLVGVKQTNKQTIKLKARNEKKKNRNTTNNNHNNIYLNFNTVSTSAK